MKPTRLVPVPKVSMTPWSLQAMVKAVLSGAGFILLTWMAHCAKRYQKKCREKEKELLLTEMYRQGVVLEEPWAGGVEGPQLVTPDDGRTTYVGMSSTVVHMCRSSESEHSYHRYNASSNATGHAQGQVGKQAKPRLLKYNACGSLTRYTDTGVVQKSFMASEVCSHGDDIGANPIISMRMPNHRLCGRRQQKTPNRIATQNDDFKFVTVTKEFGGGEIVPYRNKKLNDSMCAQVVEEYPFMVPYLNKNTRKRLRVTAKPKRAAIGDSKGTVCSHDNWLLEPRRSSSVKRKTPAIVHSTRPALPFPCVSSTSTSCCQTYSGGPDSFIHRNIQMNKSNRCSSAQKYQHQEKTRQTSSRTRVDSNKPPKQGPQKPRVTPSLWDNSIGCWPPQEAKSIIRESHVQSGGNIYHTKSNTSKAFGNNIYSESTHTNPCKVKYTLEQNLPRQNQKLHHSNAGVAENIRDRRYERMQSCDKRPYGSRCPLSPQIKSGLPNYRPEFQTSPHKQQCIRPYNSPDDSLNSRLVSISEEVQNLACKQSKSPPSNDVYKHRPTSFSKSAAAKHSDLLEGSSVDSTIKMYRAGTFSMPDKSRNGHYTSDEHYDYDAQLHSAAEFPVQTKPPAPRSFIKAGTWLSSKREICQFSLSETSSILIDLDDGPSSKTIKRTGMNNNMTVEDKPVKNGNRSLGKTKKSSPNKDSLTKKVKKRKKSRSKSGSPVTKLESAKSKGQYLKEVKIIPSVNKTKPKTSTLKPYGSIMVDAKCFQGDIKRSCISRRITKNDTSPKMKISQKRKISRKKVRVGPPKLQTCVRALSRASESSKALEPNRSARSPTRPNKLILTNSKERSTPKSSEHSRKQVKAQRNNSNSPCINFGSNVDVCEATSKCENRILISEVSMVMVQKRKAKLNQTFTLDHPDAKSLMPSKTRHEANDTHSEQRIQQIEHQNKEMNELSQIPATPNWADCVIDTNINNGQVSMKPSNSAGACCELSKPSECVSNQFSINSSISLHLEQTPSSTKEAIYRWNVRSPFALLSDSNNMSLPHMMIEISTDGVCG